MKNYLTAFDGRKCPIDLDNPLIMIKGRDFGREYQRGSFVYPIASRGEVPGQHSSKGWMTISTLNTDTANFCGVEVGKTAVPFRDLMKISGEPMGITYDGKRFVRGGKTIAGDRAVDEMLEHYMMMQLPKELRNSKDLSRVTSSEPTQHERGIIFDSLDELAQALKVYESGSIRASKATEDQFYQDTWASDNPRAGVDDPRIFRGTFKASFVQQALDVINQGRGSLADRIIAEAHSSGGKYNNHFDYDAMGTAFFKTSVEIEQIDGKHVLGILAAYVGDKPEIELAHALGKPRGLVKAGARHQLAEIINGWVGVDINQVFGEGTFTPEQLSVLTRISTGEINRDNRFPIKLNGMQVNFGFGVGEEGNYQAEPIRARGNRIFLRTEGNGKPYFAWGLSQEEEGKIVLPEEKEKIREIQNNLSCLVQTNLS